jgi:hypothetical protein
VTDDAPRWFDDVAEPPARSRRLPTLLVAAVVPWIVLAVVLLRGAPAPSATDDPLGAGVVTAPADDHYPDQHVPPAAGSSPGNGPSTTPGDGHDHATDHSRDHTHDHDTPSHDADDSPDAGSSASPPEDRPVDGRDPLDHPTRVAHGVAEALVVAIARAWLSDAGPDLEVEGVEVDRGGYLEHVAVERIALEGDSSAVATVTVVVLDRDDDRYVGASVRRAAVPLHVTATTVHPAGQPWWLPSALDLTPQPPETAPVDDEAVTAAVRDALEAAGYRDPTVDDLAVTDGGTLVASVSTSLPDGVPVRSDVWLRVGADGAATVLGHHEDDTT